MGELAFKPRCDARMPRSDLRCPIHPSGRRTGGPRMVTAWPRGECTGIKTECRDAGSNVCEVHYSLHASGSYRRSDVVRRLTSMMIQTHVTYESSPLRAARENRSRPSRCPEGSVPNKRCPPNARGGPHSPLPRAHGICRARAPLQATGELRRLGSRHTPQWQNVPGITARPGQGAGQSPRALLDARLPPGPGAAVHGGNACRSRAVRPHHAPTSKGWEHDPLRCVVPGAHARLSSKTRTSHGSSAICKPS